MSSCQFAIHYIGDAYSTAAKIMGRQSAGQSFIRGVARTWTDGTLHAAGNGSGKAKAMLAQLEGEGFRGQLRWHNVPHWTGLGEVGALYYPSPSARELVASRNATDPAAFSFMGVTFTLSSLRASDGVAELILPPYKPWDAMICISDCARRFALELQAEMREWWREQTGATRFNTPQQPVIPLGIDAPKFASSAEQRADARDALGLADRDVAFLFAGRLAFHSKASPVPMYQALEQLAATRAIVCIEAGVFPNDSIRDTYLAAQRALAPSVRFIWVNGRDDQAYKHAWQGADVFVSLTDNIQETFGLTPVEAMAAGLPLVVSDWNGYKETVRDGIDGIRVPTILPPPGSGTDLATRHALELDSYDFYVGRASMATVVDPVLLLTALTRLADDPALRSAMGAAGRARALADYDWPVILPQYSALAEELGAIRRSAAAQPGHALATRADPFQRFAHFSTATLGGAWEVMVRPDARRRLQQLLGLNMASYACHAELLPADSLDALLAAAAQPGRHTVNTLLQGQGLSSAPGLRCLMYLWKFDLLVIRP